MRRRTATFEVADESGRRFTVVEFTTFETGRVMGGGEVPVRIEVVLQDGTQLEALVGNQQFMDTRTGKAYRRA